MKTFTVPETVTILGFSWSLAQCVEYIVDTNPQFNASRSGARSGDRIVNAVVGKIAGDVVQLLDDDWKLLDAAMLEPASGFCLPLSRSGDSSGQTVTPPTRLFIGYINAISPEMTP